MTPDEEKRIKALEQKVQCLWEAIRQLETAGAAPSEATPATETNVTGAEAEPYIEQILFDLGMPPHCAGYMNIIEVVKVLVAHPGMALQDAYASSGAKGAVERSIRYAIDIAWSRGDSKRQQTYFGRTIDPDRGKPTPQELLRTVAMFSRRVVQENRRS